LHRNGRRRSLYTVGSRFLAPLVFSAKSLDHGAASPSGAMGKLRRGSGTRDFFSREKAMRLRDKIVIITGAASGIGRATALLFAREGAKLVLNDIDQTSLDKVVNQIGADGTCAVIGSVTEEETARRLAEAAVSKFGAIDVLVNNAGIHFVRDITEMTSQEWDSVMDINLKSMFLCCKHSIPQMLKQKRGSIVNLASISSFIGQEMDGASTFAYNITKAGALQLTKSLASRYATDGIRVNCVCPGNVETNIIKRTTAGEVQEFWRHASRGEPMGRNAQPDEVANAILFLASEEASFVTGCPLLVDGGYLAR
jgi:NAD(P)-dependent dehydrogenase (short-subunit alcohol dehydrogenase family)